MVRGLTSFSKAWVVLWTAVALVLLSSVFAIPFGVWSMATLVSFGSMETIGLLKKKDKYPPLTYVMRRYLPRWLVFTTLYAYIGGVGAYWFTTSVRPWKFAALFGLLGWLTTHFDVTYDGPGE